MRQLTEDETTVLLLARGGKHLVPIGRWEKPIRDLTRDGMLREVDSVNFVITEQGRVVSAEAEDEPFRQMIETSSKIKNAQQQAHLSVEQAAIHLSIAARASSLVTGDSVQHAAREWHTRVLERCLELLDA